MQRYTLFAEIGSNPTGDGKRSPHSPKPFDADDDDAAMQNGRKEFGRLIMQGAQWVRVLVVTQSSAQLVAEFRYPARGP